MAVFSGLSSETDIRLLKMTVNFDVLTLVVTSDMKNITQTMSRSWLFWLWDSPSDSKGDLLPSDGSEREYLLFKHMIIRMHEIVEMIPINVK